jgi:hypothetical protein
MLINAGYRWLLLAGASSPTLKLTESPASLGSERIRYQPFVVHPPSRTQRMGVRLLFSRAGTSRKWIHHNMSDGMRDKVSLFRGGSTDIRRSNLCETHEGKFCCWTRPPFLPNGRAPDILRTRPSPVGRMVVLLLSVLGPFLRRGLRSCKRIMPTIDRHCPAWQHRQSSLSGPSKHCH